MALAGHPVSPLAEVQVVWGVRESGVLGTRTVPAERHNIVADGRDKTGRHWWRNDYFEGMVGIMGHSECDSCRRKSICRADGLSGEVFVRDRVRSDMGVGLCTG